MTIFGHLFDRQTRQTFACFGLVGFVGLMLYDAFIWYLVCIANSTDKNTLLLVAFLFSVLTFFFGWSGYRNYQILYASYSLGDSAVLTFPNGKTYIHPLSAPYTYDRLTLVLFLGKGSRKFSFWMISPVSVKLNVSDCNGIRVITEILKSGAILLPADQAIFGRISRNTHH